MDTGLLQERLEELRAGFGLPALAAGIAADGTETILVSGVRKADNPTPVAAGDKFHMGSCGKAITAALVRQLSGEGYFSLDAVLAAALRGIEMAACWQDVTLRQLLTHTSGLCANYPDLPRLHKLDTKLAPDAIRRDIVEEILHAAEGAPRGAFLYSNMGYIILGHVCEQAAEQPYEDLVRQRIFNRLGMDSAGFGCAAGADPDQPWGHLREDGMLQPLPMDNPKAYAPAGTMHASLSDWLKLLASLAGEVTKAEADGYGEAAFTRRGDIFSHDGSNTMNYARAILVPRGKAAIIIASNDGSQQAQQAVNDLSVHILKMLGQPIPG
jgi:D-alanyl-D-alanine carboxypeptidase